VSGDSKGEEKEEKEKEEKEKEKEEKEEKGEKGEKGGKGEEGERDGSPESLVPSLATVQEFFTYLFSKSQVGVTCIGVVSVVSLYNFVYYCDTCYIPHTTSASQLESDCIIIALIYCERLVKETKGRLCIVHDNWRSVLFACLVMASKV
jgi:hypothetical protein